MAGLSLLSGVKNTPPPSYSNVPAPSVTAQAFGPGVTMPTASKGAYLSPAMPTGLALWVGVAALVGLVALRHSLPN